MRDPVAFLPRERYEALDETAAIIPGPPDRSIEVLSPANRPGELHANAADYLAAGTTLVWMVDPERELLTAHRHVLATTMLAGRDPLAAEDLVPGLSMPVQRLFSRH